ncbi:MAG: hypothetical protein LBF67_02745 [Prevotellaceae bacterium]|jgi:hypothetical protein|nr:hypothetical protein [Prevotellaceae bacterium]
MQRFGYMHLKVWISLSALSVAAPLVGQKHEVSVYGEGGLSTLHYSLPQEGSRQDQLGGGGGLGYAFLFADYMGVATGVGLSAFRAGARLPGSFGSVAASIDEYDESFELRSSLSGYTEKQSLITLSLPLMVHCQSGVLSGKYDKQLYFRAGLRLELPILGSYQSGIASLTNTIYYPEHKTTLSQPAYKGLGTFSGRVSSGSLNLALSATACVEAGVKWDVSRRLPFNRNQLPFNRLLSFNSRETSRNRRLMYLYTGIYFSYGLNDVLRGADVGDVIHRSEDAPAEFRIGSLLTSRYEAESYFTGKALLIGGGITLRLSFNLSSQKQTSNYFSKTQAAQNAYR